MVLGWFVKLTHVLQPAEVRDDAGQERRCAAYRTPNSRHVASTIRDRAG